MISTKKNIIITFLTIFRQKYENFLYFLNKKDIKKVFFHVNLFYFSIEKKRTFSKKNNIFHYFSYLRNYEINNVKLK